MLTREIIKNQTYDLTPFTEEQLDYLIHVVNHMTFPWQEMDADNIQISKQPFFYDGLFVLLIDNLCYMTTQPLDLLDHKSILDQAEGNVLLTGLGLGVGALIAQLNPRITKLTILENNQDVIKHILPMIEPSCTHVKPNVILCDANTYATEEHFDFAFIDHAFQRADESNFVQKCNKIVVWFDECKKVIQEWQ